MDSNVSGAAGNSPHDLNTEVGLLRALIDNLPDRMYVKDRVGRYLLDNIRHARSVGCESPNEVVGKTSFDLFPEKVAKLFTSDDQAVIHGGMPMVNRVEPITRADGKRIWVLTTKVPLRDRNGVIVGVVGISRDVTRQRRSDRRARALRRFLDSIVENIPNMIFVKDAKELRFIRFNRAGEKLLGCPREQMLGHNDYDVFPKDEADFFTANDRAVLEGGQLLDIPEEPIATPQGIRILHTQKIPILSRSGKPRFLLGISEDITRRKQAEEKLLAQNHQLAELAESERKANEERRRAQSHLVQTEKLASLGQLVAGVAHEINNPLAFVTNNVAVVQRNMTAFTELLKLYHAASPAIAQSDPVMAAAITELEDRIDLPYFLGSIPELLNRSREGLRRIQQIVLDLRNFARQDDGASRFEPCSDLNAGIESTINIVRGRARRKSVDIVADLAPLPSVKCQPARIHQVVLNLIANAIDACDQNGIVTVRTLPTDNGIEIRVIDTGTGISAEIRDRIFDPFFTTKSQGEGTGLGLSISHGIITDHGGTISVESTVGKGSTFTVRLPASQRATE